MAGRVLEEKTITDLTKRLTAMGEDARRVCRTLACPACGSAHVVIELDGEVVAFRCTEPECLEADVAWGLDVQGDIWRGQHDPDGGDDGHWMGLGDDDDDDDDDDDEDDDDDVDHDDRGDRPHRGPGDKPPRPGRRG